MELFKTDNHNYRKHMFSSHITRKLPTLLATFVLLVSLPLLVSYVIKTRTNSLTQTVKAERPTGLEADVKRLQKMKDRADVYSLTKEAEALLSNGKVNKGKNEKSKRELETLLQERKRKLIELAQQDPQNIVESFLAEEDLKEAQSISPDVEQKISITGTFSSIHVHGDNFFNQEEEKNLHFLQSGLKQYALYGDISFSGFQENSTIQISGYLLGDAIVVTNQPAARVSQVQAVTAETTMNLAVIAVVFSDSAPMPYTMTSLQALFNGSPGNDIVSYFQEASYGNEAVNPSFYGIYTLPMTRNAACASSSLDSDIMNAANNDINYTDFNRIVFVRDCTGFQASGPSTITTPDGPMVNGRKIWINGAGLGDNQSKHIIAHEMAHTLGSNTLSHAGYYDCHPDSFISPSNFGEKCTTIGYGDPFDVLGVAGDKLGHLNAYHKNLAGWFGAGNYITASPGTNAYTLEPLESPSTGIQGIYIPRGNSGTSFSLEYRQPIGFDAWVSNPSLCKGCNVTQGPSLKFNYFNMTADTQGIDQNPYSGVFPSNDALQDYNDGAALTPGQVFTDSEYGVSIRTLSASANGTVVEVTVPSQSCTRAAPTATISPSSQIAAGLDTKEYVITVTNRDSAGCTNNTFGLIDGNVNNSVYPYFNPLITPSYLNLAPGTSGTMTLSLTPKDTLSNGSYAMFLDIYSNSLGLPYARINFSYQLTAAADANPPTAPANLVTAVVGSRQINLSWEGSVDDVGVAGYRVFRDTRLIATLPSSVTSRVDTLLAPSTTYSYYIQAFDRKGNSTNSQPVTASTPVQTDFTYPQCPQNAVTQTAIPSATSVSFSWLAGTDNVGVTAYYILRNNVWWEPLPPSALSYSDSTIPLFSTKHRYDVYVMDGAGKIAPCFPEYYFVSGAPGTVPPQMPTNVQAQALDSNHIHISWNANTEANITGYALYRGSRKLTTITAGTSYEDMLVTGNSWYSYFVQALDLNGNVSSYSKQAWVLTPLTSLTVTSSQTATSTQTPTSTLLPTSTPTLAVLPTNTLTPMPTAAQVDTVPPSVSITAPSNNATVTKNTTVSINASASDNVGVTKVEMYVNNVLTCTDTTLPYSCSWKVPAKPNTTYTLKAIAYDARGNTGVNTITVKSSK